MYNFENDPEAQTTYPPSFRQNCGVEGVAIRLAVASEHAALVDLLRRSALTVEKDREALLANIESITFSVELIHTGRAFVALLAEKTVGFAAVKTNSEGDEFLEKLFIEPDFMRRGIGRLLVDHCVDFAASQRASKLGVVANPDAEYFYRSCGFEIVGTYPTRFGPALLMERAI